MRHALSDELNTRVTHGSNSQGIHTDLHRLWGGEHYGTRLDGHLGPYDVAVDDRRFKEARKAIT